MVEVARGRRAVVVRSPDASCSGIFGVVNSSIAGLAAHVAPSCHTAERRQVPALFIVFASVCLDRSCSLGWLCAAHVVSLPGLYVCALCTCLTRPQLTPSSIGQVSLLCIVSALHVLFVVR